MPVRCLLGKVLVVIIVLSLSAPGQSYADPPTPTTQLVRGEIFMVTSELVVVSVEDGSRVLFQLDKDTRMDRTLKVGDRVEIRLGPDQRVLSVKKLTGEVRAPGGGALTGSLAPFHRYRRVRQDRPCEFSSFEPRRTHVG